MEAYSTSYANLLESAAGKLSWITVLKMKTSTELSANVVISNSVTVTSSVSASSVGGSRIAVSRVSMEASASRVGSEALTHSVSAALTATHLANHKI
jgi:hypothetical protein